MVMWVRLSLLAAFPNVPRIFHGGYAASLTIGFELHKYWCAILGLNQWQTTNYARTAQSGVLSVVSGEELPHLVC
jgi:hypothetical protein